MDNRNSHVVDTWYQQKQNTRQKKQKKKSNENKKKKKELAKFEITVQLPYLHVYDDN